MLSAAKPTISTFLAAEISMLWICVHLPLFSLELFTRGAETVEPFAVAGGDARTARIVACNAPAQALGARRGMTLSAARAIAPGLCVRSRDERRERVALEGLAAWAGQFSPLVTLVPPRELLLEVAASLRLFGGLESLLDKVLDGLSGLGYAPRVAWAPTPLGASVIARSGEFRGVSSVQELALQVRGLGVTHLGLTQERLDALRGMGVQDVGELMRLPRDGLARRLGPDLPILLDRLLGHSPDPRATYRARPRFISRLSLPAEVAHTGGLLFPARRQLNELCGALRARAGGVERLSWKLYHPGQPATRVELGLTLPSRDPDHLLSLFSQRIERLSLPGPVQEIALHVADVRPLEAQSGELFGKSAEQGEKAAALLERLRARLGEESVQGLWPVDDHRPERAWRPCAPGDSNAGVPCVLGRRPLWLLTQPRPLAVEDELPVLDGLLTLESGAERIESGWWDGCDVARDYFVARDPRGERLWVFRELRGRQRWFVHGIFA